MAMHQLHRWGRTSAVSRSTRVVVQWGTVVCGEQFAIIGRIDKGEADMSIKSAKAYVDRLSTDSRFGQSIKNAPDAASRTKIVSSAGFTFTKAELDSVVSALSKDQIATFSAALTALAPGEDRNFV